MLGTPNMKAILIHVKTKKEKDILMPKRQKTTIMESQNLM